MTLLWVFLAILLLFLLMFAGVLNVARNWVYQATELQQAGIEATGVIVEKAERRNSRHIRYQYTDQFGKTHQRKVLVLPDQWDVLQEQGPVAIVYSEKRPHISAPKYLLDLARERRSQRRAS